MKISQAKSFLKTLESSNKVGHYLTVHGSHEYSVISGATAKTDKSLNTAKIADAIEECFEALKNGDISTKHRTELMKNFKTQIKHYNSRVYRSKKWYQKIGSWFGAVSAGEKKINTIAKQVRIEKKTNKTAVKEFQRIHENFTTRQELKLAREAQREKKVYMRMFGGVGSEAVRNESFEGFTQSGGIKTFVDDLIRYEETLDESKVGLKNEIKEMIQLLTKAYSISTLHELANSKGLDLDKKNDILKELQLRVSEDILALAEKGEVGDQILIPGGYEKIRVEGHAVLYQITKTSQNNCSFTIINTGDGAKASSTAKGIGSSIANAFSQMIFDSNIVREQVKDIKYDNVQFKDLDVPFLKGIFEQQFNPNEKNPMKVIQDRINTSLTKDHQVRKTTGREHSAQEIGSCTLKSISSWLKESFGSEKEYNKFKAVHTKWDMDKLQEIRDKKAEGVNSFTRTKGKEKNLQQLDNMLTEGERVLRKRQNKAR